MPKVTFILGLCGSGKSHLADEMVKDLGVRKFDENFILEEHQQQDLFNSLRAGIDCVLIEIHYCMLEYRDPFIQRLKQEVPDVAIEWIAFKNDLATANRNCELRTNKGKAKEHKEINGRLSPHYIIPSGAEVRPIIDLAANPPPR